MLADIKNKLEELKEKLLDVQQAMDISSMKEELKKIDMSMSSTNFWEDQGKAKEITQRRKWLEETIKEFERIKSTLETLQELLEEVDEEDLETLSMIAEEIQSVEKPIRDLEIKTFLSEEMDKNNAYLTVQAGAGGTEACDWASMLLRMYRRWAEKHGYEVEVIDINPDDVAGIKSATLLIKGPYAYGYLKGESGVHRLVRISPFDANARRHTSFASVSVVPQIDEKINIEIREEDIQMETFRASGAGGQYVNKTDTAVRIRHIPTGITVSCQQERSQFQNRLKALELLKAKLYQLELQKLEEKKKALEGEKTDIGWGYQIRSYVFQPYQMVKDLRTGLEVGNVDAVMDGDIDSFIEEYLRWKAKEKVKV
ncbi:peptide chain release factor 2 [Hydrogenobacter thermophilus TK-6]|uniref:Peptide chain release factor 2 n=1 Tax=Hydrogenobacter thermophilus (strain DSM 6534 / IAM 12695 / TK-6) TaxID=608538 RepID=D3DGV3_HYDTT|nr:peptide chain release factor 2 [Hydrogenobacter thermophilus]ADO44991.1 peptide chain release factor 2 [Hydrogenobacter thermophilus TK-6]BAI69055.1 peptide chain release factor RF-2 [Hydrogenobacter thermophilus TK-6]